MGKSENIRAARAGIGYTIGNVLSKGLSFLTMPLFGRLLSVEDYGRYNTFTAYTSVVFVIAGLAVHVSIKNANIDYKGKIKEYNSSISLIIILNSIVLFILAAVLGKPLKEAGITEYSWIYMLVVLESFCMAVITFYNHVLAVEYSHKEYVLTSLIYAVMGIVFSLVFIECFFEDRKYLGRIFGMLLAGTVFTFYILVKTYKNARPKIVGHYIKYALKISIPVVPHGISQMVLSMSDRMMITGYCGDKEAGIYGFANNLGTIFNVVTSAMDTAWSQWFFDKMAKDEKKLIRKAATVYVLMVALGTVILMASAPELILLMGGEKYREGCIMTSPIIAAAFFSYMYCFPSAVEFYHKKTMLIGIGTVFVAVLNVVLNIIFIPKFGFEAAAYTTLVCYFLYYLIHLLMAYLVQREFLFDMKVHLGCSGIILALGALFIFTEGRLIFRIPIFAAGLLVGIYIVLKKKHEILRIIKG